MSTTGRSKMPLLTGPIQTQKEGEYRMDAFITSLANLATSVGSTLILAVLVLIIGKIMIGTVLTLTRH